MPLLNMDSLLGLTASYSQEKPIDSLDSQENSISFNRQSKHGYLFLVVFSKYDTYPLNNKDFGFDEKDHCRTNFLRMIKVNDVQIKVLLLTVGQHVPLKKSDGSIIFDKNKKIKTIYQPSNKYTYGTIIYFPPYESAENIKDYIDIPGYINLRLFYDRKILDKYELVRNIKYYYTKYINNPNKLYQITPLHVMPYYLYEVTNVL